MFTVWMCRKYEMDLLIPHPYAVVYNSHSRFLNGPVIFFSKVICLILVYRSHLTSSWISFSKWSPCIYWYLVSLLVLMLWFFGLSKSIFDFSFRYFNYLVLICFQIITHSLVYSIFNRSWKYNPYRLPPFHFRWTFHFRL